MSSLPLKLNLGCCDAALPGFVNVDIVPGPGVDLAADLRQPWPWPESSVGFVRAWDIIEHLPDKIHTMNELWRVHGGHAERKAQINDPSAGEYGLTEVPAYAYCAYIADRPRMRCIWAEYLPDTSATLVYFQAK